MALITNIILITLMFSSSISSTTEKNEYDALADFFRVANFSVEEKYQGKFCVMNRITCSGHHVKQLLMQDLNLTGSICPALGKITHLTTIRLDGNHLHGIIPESLTSLKYLKLLNISGNYLGPPFPKFNDSVHVILNATSTIPSNAHIPNNSHPYRIFLLVLLFGLCVAVFIMIVLWRKYRSCLSRTDEEPVAMPFSLLQNATQDFSLECVIGQGSTSTIYLGNFGDGMVAAIKKLHATNQFNYDSTFVSEVGVLSRARHPNIIKMFGYYREGAEIIIALEYFPRGSLHALLFPSRLVTVDPLSWPTRLKIAMDVARGLEYLHGLRPLPVVHRDVKSENILIDANFKAKLSDFGLSMFLPDEGTLVDDDYIVGTTGYMAPDTQNGRYNTKADVYSFGVILMELITGRMAYNPRLTATSQILVTHFRGILASRRQSILNIADHALGRGLHTSSILAVADLAQLCTEDQHDQRPSMAEVVHTLSRLV